MSMRHNVKSSPSRSSSLRLNCYKLEPESNGNESVISESFSASFLQNEPILSSSSSSTDSNVEKNEQTSFSSSRPVSFKKCTAAQSSTSSHNSSQQCSPSTQNQNVNLDGINTHSLTPGIFHSSQNQNAVSACVSQRILNQNFTEIKVNNFNPSSHDILNDDDNNNNTNGEEENEQTTSQCSPASRSAVNSWPSSASDSSDGNNLNLTSNLSSSSQSEQQWETRFMTSQQQFGSDENRPSLFLTSVRSRSSFSVRLVQVRRRQLAAGRLQEEEEEEDEVGSEVSSEQHSTTLVTLRLPHHAQSNDSLHVNVNEDEMDNNEDLDHLDQLVDDGGDELALHESSSSSSSESANGRGDAVSGTPSSTDSDTEDIMTTAVSSFNPSRHQDQVMTTAQFENKNLVTGSGKYGTLTLDLRPRPAFGHRYVISSNEVHSRRRRNDNESRLLTSWLPTYAERIECILQEFIKMDTDNGQETAPKNMGQLDDTNENDNPHDPTSFELVYVHLKGDPPSRLLEFAESSESEESCIRSISADTRRRKSCLKISPRDGGSVGESRPKNLSWSQHIYIAQIPAYPPEEEAARAALMAAAAEGDSKTRSCPGIYYMGQFSIRGRMSGGEGMPLSRRDGSRKRRRKKKRKRIVKMVTSLFLSCLRCQPSPSPSAPIGRLTSSPNLTQQQQTSQVPLESNNGNKSLCPVKSKNHLGGMCSAHSVTASRRSKSSKI